MGKASEADPTEGSWLLECLADEIRQEEPDFGLVLNDDPRKQFAVNLEANVVEAVSLSEEEADRPGQVEEIGHPLATIDVAPHPGRCVKVVRASRWEGVG